MRTVVGAATGNADTFDSRATHRAWLTLAAKQPSVIEVALAMASITDEAGKRRAAVIDRIAKDGRDRLVQPAQLVWSEAGGRLAWVDAGQAQTFVGVDIADDGNRGLIKQRGLDRRRSMPRQLLPEYGEAEFIAQRFTAHADRNRSLARSAVVTTHMRANLRWSFKSSARSALSVNTARVQMFGTGPMMLAVEGPLNATALFRRSTTTWPVVCQSPSRFRISALRCRRIAPIRCPTTEASSMAGVASTEGGHNIATDSMRAPRTVLSRPRRTVSTSDISGMRHFTAAQYFPCGSRFRVYHAAFTTAGLSGDRNGKRQSMSHLDSLRAVGRKPHVWCDCGETPPA